MRDRRSRLRGVESSQFRLAQHVSFHPRQQISLGRLRRQSENGIEGVEGENVAMRARRARPIVADPVVGRRRLQRRD